MLLIFFSVLYLAESYGRPLEWSPQGPSSAGLLQAGIGRVSGRLFSLPLPVKLVNVCVLDGDGGCAGSDPSPTSHEDADLAPKKDTLFSNKASYSCQINPH